MPIFKLTERASFPPPHFADENGLLAFGGDLTISRLLHAYSMGVFPWYSEGDPILWWSPDPRLVVFPDKINVSRSLRKEIRRGSFHVTLDTAFDQVISLCAESRIFKGDETWIVDEMKDAYCRLHRMGYAHSVEAWKDGELAGGLYGVSLGRCFFGESMFTRVSNASKVSFVTLVKALSRHSFDMIDCQVKTDHLVSLGAEEIPREVFLNVLKKSLTRGTLRGKWRLTGDGIQVE